MRFTHHPDDKKIRLKKTGKTEKVEGKKEHLLVVGRPGGINQIKCRGRPCKALLGPNYDVTAVVCVLYLLTHHSTYMYVLHYTTTTPGLLINWPYP
jgi:hypothetical protein